MRAHIPVNRKTRDELEAIGQKAVEHERQDIATRCLYIVLLACWQIGLAPRTMRRIKGAIPVVTEKFAAYRTLGQDTAGRRRGRRTGDHRAVIGGTQHAIEHRHKPNR